MKKFIFIVITIIQYHAFAQKKPILKNDTIKNNRQQYSDSVNVKYPLRIITNKFDRIDSADLALNPSIPIEKYGFVDTADLKMTACEFEKDANAMVLFDRGEMALSVPEIILERQKRLKIFNDNGKEEANIRIEYNNQFGTERILGLQGETINFENGKITYTKLDPKLIYTEHTDKNKDAVLFTMPNVKAGSIIEYRYIWSRLFSGNFPAWDFQCNLPTRYSQLDAFINPMLVFSVYCKKNQPFVRDTVSMNRFGHVWALANISSTRDEPYMRSAADILQNLTFIVSAVKVYGKTTDLEKSWTDIGKELITDKTFYKPFDQGLHDEDGLLKQEKKFNTEDEKISFFFNQVKDQMKWNEEKNWISMDGIKNAWKKKSGNWGEINMILFRLLNESGIKAFPMLVSTRDNGKLLPDFVNIYQINKLVVYIPVDSSKYYILDASDKYNSYNEIPFELLNSYGLYLNKEKGDAGLVFLKMDKPVKQVVFINAEIKPNGTMNGSAQISSSGYQKGIVLELHKTLDDDKYKNFLKEDDNNVKIVSDDFENAGIDSLPLIQNVKFSVDLPGTDDKYVYFNPNLFTSLHDNPFLSKYRTSDIDLAVLILTQLTEDILFR